LTFYRTSPQHRPDGRIGRQRRGQVDQLAPQNSACYVVPRR